MANISKAERERRAAEAARINEQQGEAPRPVPSVVAPERPPEDDTPYVPKPLEVVKTKYQLGRDLYAEEEPGHDFGNLTEAEQADYIKRGCAAWDDQCREVAK